MLKDLLLDRQGIWRSSTCTTGLRQVYFPDTLVLSLCTSGAWRMLV